MAQQLSSVIVVTRAMWVQLDLIKKSARKVPTTLLERLRLIALFVLMDLTVIKRKKLHANQECTVIKLAVLRPTNSVPLELTL